MAAAAPRRPSQDRQAELVDAALQIIATRGIAELTTRSLAEQVGLTSGAIFRHFPSLDALLDAVVDRVEALLEATYPPAELPPRARLERFVEARAAAVGQQRGVLALMLSDQFRLALPASGSARLTACAQRTRAYVHACLTEAQAAGEVRDDVDAGALAMIVMGTMQMLARTTASAAGRGAPVRAVRDGLSTLLAPPPRRRRTRSP